ncbi:MAG: hypothetical protein JO255_09420 [Alphaproteobacteria bacterium]|nr:hypothetical protein [Alphaproteobacteria bacterium]
MSPNDAPSRPQDDLPYRIVLCSADPADATERVLARALSVQLARAIFAAAQREYPDRRVILQKGNHIVADSSGPAEPR